MAKSTITSGKSTTLTWATSNATTVSIDNGVGTVTGTSATVSPATTTTYTLTATNSAGASVTAKAAVTVVPPAAITSFSSAAANGTITSGGSTTLSWTTSNATTLSINNGIGAVTGTSTTVSPTATTAYTLTATNAAGDSVSSSSLTVRVLPGIKFTTSASSVTIGGSGATLSWTVADYTSLSLSATSGGNTKTTDVSGTTSLAVNPVATTDYVLTAQNSDGSTTSSTIEINAVAASNITSFLASPTASTSSGVPVSLTALFGSGGTAVITYTDDQGNSGTAFSSVLSGAAVSVSPSISTTYTLTAGTETQNLRVIVGNITNFAGLSVPQAYDNPFVGDGDLNTAQFNAPVYITTDSKGNAYFSDDFACVVEKLDKDGKATQFAGIDSSYNCPPSPPADGDPLTQATFGWVNGIAFDPSGNIYLADASDSEIREFSKGTINTLAGSYLSTSQDIDNVGSAAAFALTPGIADAALDSLGELIVAEGNTIRVMDSSYKVTTLAGKVNLGLTCNSTTCDGTGKTGTGSDNARFSSVVSMAMDTSTDTIYLLDSAMIRVMTPDKSVAATVCAGISNPGAACWTWTVRTWINPTNTPGYQDGSASVAQFKNPRGIARAADGTIFVADYRNSRIRRITTAGVVDTIAGDGTSCDDPYTGCTLPNSDNAAAEPLPGVTYRPLKIAVDPTQKRLFFDVSDVTGIYSMPY